MQRSGDNRSMVNGQTVKMRLRLSNEIRALRRSRFVRVFLHSDLLGVPITLAFFGIFAVSLTVFYFGAASVESSSSS